MNGFQIIHCPDKVKKPTKNQTTIDWFFLFWLWYNNKEILRKEKKGEVWDIPIHVTIMDKLWKRLGLPLLIIVIGSISYRMLASLRFANRSSWLTVLCMVIFFMFGMALNSSKRKRNSGWVGKLLISFVLFFYLMFNLGWMPTNQVLNILAILGLTNQAIAIPAIVILCGYTFFD